MALELDRRGTEWLAFDVLGAGLAAVLAVLAAVAVVRGTRALVRVQGWTPRGRGERDSRPATGP